MGEVEGVEAARGDGHDVLAQEVRELAGRGGCEGGGVSHGAVVAGGDLGFVKRDVVVAERGLRADVEVEDGVARGVHVERALRLLEHDGHKLQREQILNNKAPQLKQIKITHNL